MIKNFGLTPRPVWCASFALLGVVAAGPANAATQGTLGATSQGSVVITATIDAKARISGLDDITFSSLDALTNASQSDNACVWSNTATKGYKIRASGSGTGNAFTLANAATATVPYSVAWATTTGATSGTALTTGTDSGTLTSSATAPDCGAGTNSTLLVSIAANDQQAMTSGDSYTGTLTLLVTPL